VIQRGEFVVIARAMANDPLLILADEPTGNLDTAASKNVEQILRELAHEHGRAVVVVTHESRLAAGADRTIPSFPRSAWER
jgi:lipoprotein-releasing system ATP-binding protein